MFDKSQLLSALSQFIFGMFGATIIQIFFNYHYQKIVTVDITGMVKSFESEAIKQKLSPEDMSIKINKFGIALNSAILTYSSRNNYILVPKEVVISGAIDKTNSVREMIKKRLNQ